MASPPQRAKGAWQRTSSRTRRVAWGLSREAGANVPSSRPAAIGAADCPGSPRRGDAPGSHAFELPLHLSTLHRQIAGVSLAAAASLSTAATVPPAASRPARNFQEVHQRLDTSVTGHERDVALTLDACGGQVDLPLVATLVRLRLPATIFVTRRWIDRNPEAMRELVARPELFQIEDHGAAHRPAVIGGRLYGMKGSRDAKGVALEIEGGAEAIAGAGAPAPRWYRGAGAAYDDASLAVAEGLQMRIAGFSLNADEGATLDKLHITRRLQRVQPGEVILAHMNKPASATGSALAGVLPQLMRRGLHFVTLAQAAGVRTLAPRRVPASQPPAGKDGATRRPATEGAP